MKRRLSQTTRAIMAPIRAFFHLLWAVVKGVGAVLLIALEIVGSIANLFQ